MRILFGMAVFLSALFLFSVQPMTGKSILPIIGGTAQGWLVTLAFFQIMLLGGYVLVYLSRNLRASYAGFALSVLMLPALATFLLPNTAPDALDDAGSLFLYLLQWLGLPLVCLSCVAPLLQRLFAAHFPGNPYRLYALSNVGSLIGLLSYPLILEPLFGLHVQQAGWQIGFAVLFGLLLMCAIGARGDAAPQTNIGKPALKKFGLWVALAAAPASLLSGTTFILSTDIGSFPMLWVIPLALYLLTYIAAFAGWKTQYLPNVQFYVGFAAAIVSGLQILGYATGILASSPLLSFLVLTTIFTLAAFACHSRLYSLRPDATQLPVFYVALALGGALGGGFNVFVAPMLFSSSIEFYLALVLATALLLPAPKNLSTNNRKIFLGIAALVMIVVLAAFQTHTFTVHFVLGIFALYGFAMLMPWPRLMVISLLVGLLMPHSGQGFSEDTLHRTRNFFGILRVAENADGDHLLVHGTTLHGKQPSDPAYAAQPVSYYNRAGPAGDIAKIYKGKKMAVVGLGTGQMACYGTTQSPVDFFEIDPDIFAIANNPDYFTYLKNCADGEIIFGDARLSLSRSTKKYDVIVLDAFSSDAIPQHLLTTEAITTYRDHLNPGGIIAFHISNRFLDLDGPLSANAGALGLTAIKKDYWPASTDSGAQYANASIWVGLTDAGDAVEAFKAKDWVIQAPKGAVWTDDYSPVLSSLRIFKKP